MACVPPFVNGTDDACGCNCKCCPPPCCDTIEQTYQCGTSSDSWPPEVDSNEGCDCGGAFRMRGQNTQLPQFTSAPIRSGDGQFVFALDSTCSIPCTDITVSITTSGCCLEESLTAVGDGTVSASADTEPDPECGAFIVKVNGQEDSADVSDGDSVSVSVETEDSCCPCCMLSQECAVPHTSMTQSLLTTSVLVRTTKKGNSPSYKINKKLLIEKAKERALKLKRQRLINRRRRGV